MDVISQNLVLLIAFLITLVLCMSTYSTIKGYLKPKKVKKSAEKEKKPAEKKSESENEEQSEKEKKEKKDN